ncbi:MAG: DUF2905 domain-containing protein [Balneolales bacterium]|nr:DUF2905 domain-containing protein [Balneolales bacterium]
MNTDIAKILIIVGGFLLLAGLIMYFFGSKMSWFGQLPGDIQYESGRSRIHFPVVTMIILSIALTIIINIFRRIF